MINLDIKKYLSGSLGKMELSIKLEIKNQEFIALSGKSGSGKTTFLRILAGLETARGKIIVDDKTWLKNKKNLAPQKRKLGFVFQDYALFTNMSVMNNLLFVRKDLNLANKLLGLTELKSLENMMPENLSGGQKQRLSLCRALMSKPKLLLLDEPLSALDPLMREKLQNDILHLHQEFGLTSIIVSHEPSEIYKLASRVLVLENGKLIKDGSPKEVLLKTSGSQKFSFEAKLIDIKKIDIIYVAIVAIGQQLSEIVISQSEVKELKIGDRIKVSTKAFSPIINKIE